MLLGSASPSGAEISVAAQVRRSPALPEADFIESRISAAGEQLLRRGSTSSMRPKLPLARLQEPDVRRFADECVINGKGDRMRYCLATLMFSARQFRCCDLARVRFHDDSGN